MFLCYCSLASQGHYGLFVQMVFGKLGDQVDGHSVAMSTMIDIMMRNKALCPIQKQRTCVKDLDQM